MKKYRIKTKKIFDGENNPLKSKYHVVKPIFFGWIELSTYFFGFNHEISHLSTHKAIFDTIEVANNYINNYTNDLAYIHNGYKIIKYLHDDMTTEGFVLINDAGHHLPHETLYAAKDTANRFAFKNK